MNLSPALLALAAATVLSASASAQAVQYDASYLNGGYAYNLGGSALDPIGGLTTRIAEAGRMYADGAGNISGTDTVMISGAIVRRTFGGSYTINPDGSGALVLNPSWGPPIHADFVAGEKGKILRLLLTDSGNTISGLALAQQSSTQAAPAQGYGASSLNGGFVYRIAGSAVDFYGNDTPIRETGHLTADGAGNVTGTSTVSVNGLVVRRTLTGTYILNADGSGTATLYPTWGPPIDLDLFLSANGLKVEFVVTDSGNTLSGEMAADTLPPAAPVAQ